MGCGVTLLAMGVFAMVYPWPEKMDGPQGLATMGVRMALLTAGVLGIVALGIGLYIRLLKKSTPPDDPGGE